MGNRVVIFTRWFPNETGKDDPLFCFEKFLIKTGLKVCSICIELECIISLGCNLAEELTKGMV
jgi:hypothetical protein